MLVLGADMDHWCAVDEVSELPYERQKELTIPYDYDEERYSECDYYTRDFSNMTKDELCWGDFSNMTTQTATCSEWTYDRTEFVEFPVSKVISDRTCERPIHVTHACTNVEEIFVTTHVRSSNS